MSGCQGGTRRTCTEGGEHRGEILFIREENETQVQHMLHGKAGNHTGRKHRRAGREGT